MPSQFEGNHKAPAPLCRPPCQKKIGRRDREIASGNQVVGARDSTEPVKPLSLPPRSPSRSMPLYAFSKSQPRTTHLGQTSQPTLKKSQARRLTSLLDAVAYRCLIFRMVDVKDRHCDSLCRIGWIAESVSPRHRVSVYASRASNHNVQSAPATESSLRGQRSGECILFLYQQSCETR